MKKVLQSYLIMCFFMVSVALAQNKTVNGKVTSAGDGLPLPGVSVAVKGTTQVGTQTDANGNFRLSVPATAKTLVFRYIGFLSTEAAVDANINVSLKEDQKQLSEVVVVGYGTQNKQDITGSISRITSKDIDDKPLSTFETALQGTVAGVYINSGSGKLGQGLNIRIRGISSVSASNQPLFVIDGQPVISTALGSSTEPDNPLSSIAPEDIESLEVLKDASASAIYGARAANGVILITTKSGKKGATKVNLSYYTGLSNPTRKREWLNAAEYRELFTEAAQNSSFGPLNPADEFAGEAGSGDWDLNFDTNWADEAFQNGSLSNYNVNVSGGTDKSTFLIGGGYNNQKGILVGNEFNRASGRINITQKIYDRLQAGVNLNLSKTVNYRVASDNAFTNPLQLNALPPIHPKINPTTGKLNTATLYYNNLIDLTDAFSTNKQFRNLSNGFLNFDVAKGLVLRGEVGYDFIQLDEESFNGRETLDGAPLGLGFQRQVRSSSLNTNTTLAYNKLVGNHNIDLLGGFSYQESRNFATSSTGQAFPNDKFTKISSAAIVSDGSSTETGFSFLSYFSRANYKFKNKYLLSASARLDASSRFGKNNRYGLFPAASIGWIISEEGFMKNISAISSAKFRASYGTTGNAEIGNFSSRTLYSASPYSAQAGIVFSQLGREDLRWEKTNQLDIGFDFGLFKDRITAQVDYFSKETTDLLLNQPLPSSNGFTIITKNIGSLENKGYEFSINTRNFVKAFQWSTSFNISTYKNKVTSLNGATIDGGQRQVGRISEGEPFGYFYGPKYAGVDPNNGDALYFDANGNRTNDFSLAQNQKIGDPNPDYIGGFGNNFKYKGFDLDVQTQFVVGNDLYNIGGIFQSVNGDYFDNQSKDQLTRWQKPGDITDVPEARLYNGNGAGKSSRWVEDGSYFRVKFVTLGFNLPKAYLTKYKISSARIYASAINLFTITKYEGYDPEVNATYTGNVNLGHDFYTPPQAKTITFGVNLGF